MLDRTNNETAAPAQEPERVKVSPKLVNGSKLKARLKSFGAAGPTIAALAAWQVHTGERAISQMPIRGRRVRSVCRSAIWH
jgi:hypothetical protein